MSTLNRCNSLPDIDTESSSSNTICDTKYIRIARGLLFVLNTIQGLLGLGCFGVWLFIKIDRTYLSSIFLQIVDQIAYDIRPIIESSGQDLDEIKRNLNFQELLGGFSIVFVIAGFAFLFPVLWGITSACSMKPWLLILYSAILAVMVLGEIATVVILFEKRYLIDGIIKEPLKTSIEEKYQGDQGTDTISVAWNILMVKLSCCGVDGGWDFQNSGFQREIFLRILGIPYTIANLQVPLSCCNGAVRISTSNPGRCAQVPIDIGLSHYDKGCYETLWVYIEYYFKDYFIWSFVGFCAMQVITASLAIYIAKAVKLISDEKW